ncbi:recombinase family protein [Streptomyces sp. NBC_00846]|uniref:recombinase family protein n=1 Tax=Streptomyces sp. NBC_00846 TaxID=2975849 RepID=UPI00386D28E1
MPAPRTERPIRIGYARTSTARQELASQLEALHRADCHKIFKEQISTRVKVRPELEKALALAHQFKEAASEAGGTWSRYAAGDHWRSPPGWTPRRTGDS